MNIRIVAAIIVAATAATSAFADGEHGYPNAVTGNPVESTASITSSGSMVSQSGSTATREQVHQELLQAYHDGGLPASKRDYPPSPQTIALNRELHNLFEPKWAAQH